MGHKSPFQTPTLKADALAWGQPAKNKLCILTGTASQFSLFKFLRLKLCVGGLAFSPLSSYARPFSTGGEKKGAS